MVSVATKNQIFKRCISKRSKRLQCFKNIIDSTFTIETKARTPFFLSGPEFSFIFSYSTKTTTIESWFDVMVTAAASEQESVRCKHCLDDYNVHESIFKTRNVFSKFLPRISRMDSIVINLIKPERKRLVQFKIKVLTRSELSKTKPTTVIDLEWKSVVSLSRDISRKIIGLPGLLRSVTLEALGFVRNYTIDIHWIPHILSKSPFQAGDEKFCHEDLPKNSKHNYCLNYTSLQNTYLFFWNFTQYLHCYIAPVPSFRMYFEKTWAKAGFTIPINNTCPTQQSKGKVIKSWTEASQLCTSIGGYLPLIRNRDELDEIIYFLKLSKDMPPVEALYIGIKTSLKSQVTSKVSSNGLTDHCPFMFFGSII